MFRYLSQEACRLDTGSSHNGHHAMATFEGRVLKVASDAQHGFSKRAKESINLVEGHGVEGDAHAGQFVRHRFLARRWSRLPNLRQLHLISSELFEVLRILGYAVGPGDLSENVTTERALAAGDQASSRARRGGGANRAPNSLPPYRSLPEGLKEKNAAHRERRTEIQMRCIWNHNGWRKSLSGRRRDG